MLLSISYRTSLADDGDLHLSRICHLGLNLVSYLARELLCLLVVHLVGANDYAELATSLDGVSLCYARVRHAHTFLPLADA